jgi:hypothetical protein
MKTIKTFIKINASPQNVWSVMDDLQRYPEWNHLTPDLAGRTTVGSIVRGTLTKQGAPQVPIGPTINAVVGAREFRWLTKVPGFRAEHYFFLQPTADGGTELTHCEDFDGEAIAQRWAGIEATSPPAFNGMNSDLKARAEQFKATAVSLHPAVDKGAALVRAVVIGTTLRCLCAANCIEIRITRPIHHNHLCGCSKCWKPAGAHLYGDVPDVNHHFHGLCFVHPELAQDAPCGAPEFAGFVSSLIESGTCPSLMEAIRGRMAALKILAFDGFSPEIMDIIAWHKRKLTLYPQATS